MECCLPLGSEAGPGIALGGSCEALLRGTLVGGLTAGVPVRGFEQAFFLGSVSADAVSLDLCRYRALE